MPNSRPRFIDFDGIAVHNARRALDSLSACLTGRA